MAKKIVTLLARSSYRSPVAWALQGTSVTVNVQGAWKIQLKQMETDNNLQSRWGMISRYSREYSLTFRSVFKLCFSFGSSYLYGEILKTLLS